MISAERVAAKAIFTDWHASTLQIVLWGAALLFEYLNKMTWLVVIIVCVRVHTGPEKLKKQVKTNIFFFFFFLSFNRLMVGSFPSGIVSIHSFHCCITVSCCVSGHLL
jgi:phosphate starvation-inducible membrane PsiE